MAQLTNAQLVLLMELRHQGGWLILNNDSRLDYSALEKSGYVGIEVVNGSKVFCQTTADGVALLDRTGSS
jgi:hypothetical protein